jgi:hypothetical protein
MLCVAGLNVCFLWTLNLKNKLQLHHPIKLMSKYLSIAALAFISLTTGAQTVTWQTAQSVAPSSAGTAHPRIALAANGNPVVLWGKDANASVNFSRWTGAAFSAPSRVSPVAAQVFTSSWAGPDIATKGDTVYAIYKAEPEDTAGIYVVTSTNGGASFGMPVRVDNIPGYNSRFPTVTTDGAGQPIVGFMKFSTGFTNAKWVTARSMNWGTSFMPEVLASGYNGEPVCDCCPGSVVGKGNSVAMLYRNNWSDKRTIWAGVSGNNGASYPSGMEVDNTNWTINACPSSGPDGVIVGDTLYTTFMSGAAGTKVYYSKSVLSTMQSKSTVAVTGSSPGITGQNFPRIANDGNAAVMVWVQTENGQPQVGMVLAPDIRKDFPSMAVGQLAWEKAVVNPAGNTIMNADVAIKNGTIHIVWEDMASGTVMYRKGTYNTTPAGLGNIEANELCLFPVPANRELQLTLKHAEFAPCVLTVMDVAGRVILSREHSSLGSSLVVNTSTLKDGAYLLKLATEKGLLTKRFVVAH